MANRLECILIATNSDEDFAQITNVLEEAHITAKVVRVSSSSELFSYYEKSSQTPSPQEWPFPELLFLDLKLSDGNPLPKLHGLKQQTIRKFVTIVISASSEVKQIRDAYQAGADTILIKPVNTVELVNFLTFRGFRLEPE